MSLLSTLRIVTFSHGGLLQYRCIFLGDFYYVRVSDLLKHSLALREYYFTLHTRCMFRYNTPSSGECLITTL